MSQRAVHQMAATVLADHDQRVEVPILVDYVVPEAYTADNLDTGWQHFHVNVVGSVDPDIRRPGGPGTGGTVREQRSRAARAARDATL